MRDLRFQFRSEEASRLRAEQVQTDVDFWATLDTTSLLVSTSAARGCLAQCARFAVSVVHQYAGNVGRRDVLLTAAHQAVIAVLNLYEDQPDRVEKVLAFAVRNAVAEAHQH